MDPSAEQLAPIARKHGIILLLRFGSSVTGMVHERSDVDLAVLLERVPRSLAVHAELIHDLQHVFPDREVDLALLNRADPLFLRKITKACELLYGSPRESHRLKLYAFKRYQDHRKYLDMEPRYVERVSAGSGVEMIDPELVTRKMVLIMQFAGLGGLSPSCWPIVSQTLRDGRGAVFRLRSPSRPEIMVVREDALDDRRCIAGVSVRTVSEPGGRSGLGLPDRQADQ